MAYREFVSLVHKSTKRDYLARVTERDKAEVAELALKWDYDYWDGSRETGYGGYKYDGRWRKVADAMVAAYGIKPGMRILDVGAGKGFLLHDFTEAVPASRCGHRHLALRRSSTRWRASSRICRQRGDAARCRSRQAFRSRGLDQHAAQPLHYDLMRR